MGHADRRIFEAKQFPPLRGFPLRLFLDNRSGCLPPSSLEERRPELRSNILVSREEAAQLLSISVRGIDYLLATRRLPSRKIGGRVLIPVAELRKYAQGDHPERIVA